jgi:hypothetical protein
VALAAARLQHLRDRRAAAADPSRAAGPPSG